MGKSSMHHRAGQAGEGAAGRMRDGGEVAPPASCLDHRLVHRPAVAAQLGLSQQSSSFHDGIKRPCSC